MPEQFSLSDMPWLLRDVRPGQSFDDAITTASKMHADRRADESLAQRREEFEAEQREKQQFDPLKMTLLQQDIAMGVVKTAALKESREQQLRGVQQMVELGKLADNWIKTLPIEDAQKKLFVWGINNQDALVTPGYKSIEQRMDAIRKESDNLKIKTEMGKALPQSERDEARARIYEEEGDFGMAATIRAAARIRRDELIERQRLNTIAADNLKERQEGTELRRNAAVQSAVGREAQMAGEGLAPTVSLMPPPAPGATNVVPQGAAVGQPLVKPIARPLTTAEATKHQENLFNALSGMDRIARIKPLINNQTVGMIARGESLVVDRGLALLYPELANKQRIKLDELLSLQAADTLKSVKVDGNMAEPERKLYMSQIPNAKEILTTPIRAYEQLQTIQGELTRKALRSAAMLHQSIPDEAIKHIPDDMVEELVRSHTLSPAQARRWLELHP